MPFISYSYKSSFENMSMFNEISEIWGNWVIVVTTDVGLRVE